MNKNHLRRITLTLFIMMTLTGCTLAGIFAKTVEGSGEVVVEKRDLPAFTAIRAHGEIELYLTQLDSGVEVHAEGNLMKYVRTYVQEQTLVVEIADTDGGAINLKPLAPIEVYVRFEKLNSLTLSAGVKMTSSQLVAEDARIDLSLSGGSLGSINALRTGTLQVMLSGGSQLEVIDGQVTDQFISASDGSSYTADWLKSEATEIKLSRGSEAAIWAVDTFNVDLSGGSTAYYYGSPTHLNEVRNSGGSDYISQGER